MAFEVYGSSMSGDKKASSIDYDALNKYVVETAGLQQKEVLVGVVSCIVDLGMQKQEDASMTFTGSAADEQAAVAKYPDTYFEDGFDANTKAPCRLKRWPQKPVQCVAVAVDFPEIMLNKGQFFGDNEAEDKPLRLWLGGSFYLPSVGMVVGRPMPLKEKKNTKDKWSFDKKHLFYKMASAAKLIDASKDDVFKPTDIDKLLGLAFCFDVQVFFKESKGKDYYTESINFASGLSRGMKAPEYDFEPTSLGFFNSNNDLEALKEVRSHVKNTMKQALNFVGSKIEGQLNKLSEDFKQNQPQETVKEAAVVPIPKARPKAVPVLPNDEEDDAPF